MSIRHLLSIADLDRAALEAIVERAVAFRQGAASDALKGRMVGIYFRKTSTRTRTSFTVAATRLGAHTIAYGPADLQINTGETVADTGRVLSGYLDALVLRTSEPVEEMRQIAAQTRMAVVNAMSAEEHPTQAIADLTAIKAHFGRLSDLHVLYMGEGNNSAAALALAVARLGGLRLTLLTPPGYGLAPDVAAYAAEWACASGSIIDERHAINALPTNVDVVYTTRWQTTGTTKPDPDWRRVFAPFAVTADVLARVSRRNGACGTVFMHDLPAVRGEEVDASVLDGPQSIAFDQAECKLFGAMAALEWCVAAATAANARS